eukprot:TRINITY_DN2185_c1_g1_i2.p1 TRINITY_DN2185_c1_g1~~TRINITY_DN2185_c1_g1_i2.p1  ORF type:complete len:162 (+),score=17.76 TRINITY_DN2185_c1_g1_i2:79-564(+)
MGVARHGLRRALVAAAATTGRRSTAGIFPQSTTNALLHSPSSTGLTGGSPLTQFARWLSIHEYQSQELMRGFGVNVPKGIVAKTPVEVKEATKVLCPDGGEVVLKSQILAGGRGLGTFKNGFKGGVHVVKAEDAESIAGFTPSPTCGRTRRNECRHREENS